MTRRILIILALLWPALGMAYTFTLPDCGPKTWWLPLGTGTDWVRGQAQPNVPGPITSYRAWWCPKPDGTWERYIHLSVERPEWTVNLIETEITTALRSADSRATWRDLVNRYSVAPTEAEGPSWIEAANMAKAAAEAIKPPPPKPVAWVVAKNGTYATRPMWTPDGTKAVAERAPVGNSCDPAVIVTKGTQTLLRLTGSAGFTYCVKLP